MKENNVKSVVVGMSGGVDSSVAALLLKKQGYRVVGLHMRGENLETREADEKRVKEVCDKIGIEFEVVDYSSHMNLVKDYFTSEYLKGRTPNPCVICNREVKFKPFIEFASKNSFDYFATGHYAKVVHNSGKHYLIKAKDEDKDQSYFLCQLSQAQLEKALFPLGELSKAEVRKIAEQNGLVSATTKDSYDVCFLGSTKFKDFMETNYPDKSGKIVDFKTGKVIGTHTGVSKYTMGQRKGLGIGGQKGSTGEGWFVVGKDIKTAMLYVSQGDGEALLSKGLISGKFNFIPEKPQEKTFKCFAKFRYRQADQEVEVNILDGDKIEVAFNKPQRAITVGQYVVLYNAEGYMLGGATIEEILK